MASDSRHLGETKAPLKEAASALASQVLGLESGPVYVSVQHLSAIEDGVKGRGLTWLEVGVKVKLLEGGR